MPGILLSGPFLLLGYEASLVCVKHAAPSVASGVQQSSTVQENTWPAGNIVIVWSLCCVSFLINSDVLRKDDISFLMRELRPVAPKWQIFSVQLGVPASEVDVIAAKPLLLPGAPLTFLQDALTYWIRKSHPACTLNTLCDVLKSDLVNESTLAVHVEVHFWEYRAKGNCSVLY